MLRFCVIALILGYTQAQTTNPSAPICENQVSNCACETNQGWVDLSPLNLRNSTPYFNAVPDNTQHKDFYSYNPCTGFKESEYPNGGSDFNCDPPHVCDCDGVAVCQLRKWGKGTDYHNAGTPNSARFLTVDGNLIIEYNAKGIDSWNRTTQVTLICDWDEHGKLIGQGQTTEAPLYKLQLRSIYACPGATTPGNITAKTTPSTLRPSTNPWKLLTTTAGSPTRGSDTCRYWRWMAMFLIAVNTLCLLGAVLGLACRGRRYKGMKAKGAIDAAESGNTSIQYKPLK